MQSSPHICLWQPLFSVKTDKFPKMSFRRSLVTVALLVNLVHFSLAQELKFQTIEQLRQSLDSKQPESEPLTLLWGVADTTAYVGKVFRYTLPNDAFQGNVVHYSVVEAGKDRLPSFLSFNPLKAEISGIPMPKDKGQIYLEVTATGDDNSKVDDVFSIEVIDDNSLSIGSSGLAEKTVKHVRCKYEESQTSVTVIIDTDLEILHPGDKVGLLENMAGHLNLAPEMLKLLPVADKPMFDNTALVSGPGNSKMPMHAGCMMSWLVGCGKVESDHMPVLQLLEKSATNGDMSGAVGHDILGWQVTNTRFQAKPRRRRAAATATMKMNMPAPTKVTDLPPATDVTSTITATSAAIMPTRTVDVMPTATVMTTSSVETTVTETSAQPAPTEPTEPLPTKAYTMTSKTMTSTSTAPSYAVVSTTTTTVMPTTTTEKITFPRPGFMPIATPYCPPSGRGEKKAPRIKQQMIDFKLMAGDVEKYKVPEETFSDCYDQNTSDLDIEITFDDGLVLPKDFWLQLNKRSFKPYRIFANPLNTDTGSYDFIMKATNYYGKSSSQQFSVLVIGEDMAEKPASHELSVTVDMDYDKFMSSLSNRIEFSNKLARLYRDNNSKAMTVTRIDEGSVVYAWTNNTLASDSCPTSEIADLVKELITDDGKITPEAVQALKPYKIKSAAVVPLGACADSPYFPVRDTKSKKPTTPKVQVTDKVTEKVTTPAAKTTTVQPTIKYSDKPKSTTIQETTTTKVAAAGAGTGGGSDIWITTVVPAIVVLIVLIIALIIACCLYQKKRRGKMRLKEKNSFNKGVPVIFADEYDEKPNDSSHPLIMQDEKPAMPPPEYQRASSETSGGSNSTQPIGDKEIEEYEMDTDITSPLYRPPPPVTASSNNKPPPSHVQSARNPPPYVPP